MGTNWNDASDRRERQDRRRRVPTLKSLFCERRRRSVRRKSDHRGLVLLDHYSGSLMLAAVIVLLLSVVDALLTLFLMDHGAVELNPVMAYFLNLGAGTFVLAKYLITASSVVIVVLLNYVFIRHLKLFVRDLLTYFAGGFALVIFWELFLVMRFVA